MKKRLLAVAAAALLLVSQAATVFAAGSITGNVALSGEAAKGYTLTADIAQTEVFQKLEAEKPEVAKLITEVNAGTESMADFAESIAQEYPEVSQKLAGKEFVSSFFDLVAGDDAKLNAEGKYEITLSVPALTANTTDVAVLHYSTVRGLWEVIDPSAIDLEGKTITVAFEDLSPVAVIAKEGTSTSATVGSQTSGTSPKTGTGMESVLWMGAAVVLFGMAAVVSVKRRRAN